MLSAMSERITVGARRECNRRAASVKTAQTGAIAIACGSRLDPTGRTRTPWSSGAVTKTGAGKTLASVPKGAYRRASKGVCTLGHSGVLPRRSV